MFQAVPCINAMRLITPDYLISWPGATVEPGVSEMICADKEVDLLLGCSKPVMDSDCEDRIRHLLQDELDWDWILKAAHTNGVWTILYHNLKAICPEAVPHETLLTLQRAHLFNARRNLIFARELIRIIELFQESGIESVPFKGPTLAQAAYGDITLRSFSDLDIMIRKQDVLNAKDLLISRGYEPQVELTHTQERMLLKNGCEYNFVLSDPAIPVEVHWRFHRSLYSVPFDEGIWSRLDTMNIDGMTINCFPPEDMVLALCSHATGHQWSQMKLVSDIAGLIERSQMDWKQLNMIASDMGLKRILHIGLLLAHNLLDAGLPEQMLSEIEKDAPARKLALPLSRRFSAKSNLQRGFSEEGLFWLKTRERLVDKTRYLVSVGGESGTVDWNASPLPDSLFPFYRIIRPVRLFWKYGVKKKRI